MTVNLALFLHLLGASVLVAGIVVAGVAHAAARRRDHADDIALLLGLARTGVLFVGLGAVLVLVFGLWLVDVGSHSLREAWLVATLVLFGVALGLGAVGGRRPREARLLAARLAKSSQRPTPELRRLLNDRTAAAANYLATLAIVVIVSAEAAASRADASRFSRATTGRSVARGRRRQPAWSLGSRSAAASTRTGSTSATRRHAAVSTATSGGSTSRSRTPPTGSGLVAEVLAGRA